MPSPEPGPVRFVHDTAARSLRLEHPLIDATWSWNDRGRIDFTQFVHRPSETSWLADLQHDPLFLLGVAGYGDRYHPFDVPRAVFCGTVTDVEVNLPAARGCIGARVTIDLSN